MQIDNQLTVNPTMIESVAIDSVPYMNGSTHTLVIRMRSGREIRREHGYGFDAFAMKDKIEKAMQG